jgi:hypothetical protein
VRFRRTVFISCLLIGSCWGAFATARPNFESLYERMSQAYRKRDCDSFLSSFSSDVVFRQMNGTAVLKAEVEQGTRAAFKQSEMQKIDYRIQSIMPRGNAIEVVVRTYRMALVKDGYARVFQERTMDIRHLWKPHKGAWKIAEITFLGPPPPPGRSASRYLV